MKALPLLVAAFLLQSAAPPPVGGTVTFRYQELTDAGVPRFPGYIGIRES